MSGSRVGQSVVRATVRGAARALLLDDHLTVTSIDGDGVQAELTNVAQPDVHAIVRNTRSASRPNKLIDAEVKSDEDITKIVRARVHSECRRVRMHFARRTR